MDVMLRAVFQSVAQNSGDHIHVVRICGFCLNDGSERDDLIRGIAGFRNVIAHFIGELIFKVIEEAVKDRFYRIVFKELVRIREQIALELIVAVTCVRDGCNIRVAVVIRRVAGFKDLVCSVQAVFFQQSGKLLHRDALTEHDGDLFAEIRAGL